MSLISTRNLGAFPDPATLRELLRSMAMLDAILCPEWEYRYYSFDAAWSEGEQMASMRDGEGDDFFALFNAQGCFFKGFVHDSPAAAADIAAAKHYQNVPPEYSYCVLEPALSPSDVTFCLWRGFNDPAWHHNVVAIPNADDDPDGSEYLLSMIDGNPETYREWAEEYFEVPVPLAAVKAVFERQSLTDALVSALNPELRLKHLRDDLREIKYPT